MFTLEDLEKSLLVPAETEKLEFKEAKQQYDTTKLLRYCVALANEGGGHLILGVTNKPPRTIVGTQAFSSVTSLSQSAQNEVILQNSPSSILGYLV